MAGNNRKRDVRDPGGRVDRIVPSMDKGSSRVSRAAGSLGSSRGQNVQQGAPVEPRSHVSPPRQSARGRSSAQQQQSPPSRSGKPQGGKRNGSPSRSSAPYTSSKPAPSRDVQFIRWAQDKWTTMEPHQQQRFFGILLLGLALLLLGALTIFSTTPVLGPLNRAFLDFFGWGAYPLAFGLVAFAVVHLVEGIRNQHFLSWRMVIGLVLIWLFTLCESRLIMGQAGILAGFLVSPLLGWSAAIGHVVMVGLILIATVFTFRINFGHVLLVVALIQSFFAEKPEAPVEPVVPDRTDPSPFRGQRPQYSRYGDSSLGSSSGTAPAVDRRRASAGAPARAGGRRSLLEAEDDNLSGYEDEEVDNNDVTIAFEPDFPEEDPLNDINIHKQQVGTVPRGPRAPQAIDIVSSSETVRGANQQALPFDEKAHQQKLVIKRPHEIDMRMESLPPNPYLEKPMKARAAAPVAPIAPVANVVSSWRLPDTSLLNHPEEVKLQMLGDDTATLAKTIQDTLRSFRVEAEVRAEDISIGPTVIRFGIRPTGKPEMKLDEKTNKMLPVRDGAGNIIYEARTRVSRIMALQNDLALVLEAKNIRMEAPVPGRPYVGVEIPNKNSRLVTLREVLESKEYLAAKAKSKLAVALGRDVAGLVRVGDLARMPHLLIAGATGAGKCLAYDEPVFLADGRIVNVQELVGQTAQVIGVTDTQTMQQVSVPATFTENGVRDVFEIELDNGVIICRTGEHPLWAARLDENQHVGRQANGKAMRRTRAIDDGWVHVKDLRVCGNRPNFDGHVLLSPLTLHQQGTVAKPLPDQKFADCPQGYEWRKIVSIRHIVAPTVNIEVHSENHAFVGYVVEHNSVCINTIIASILTQATPDDVRMLMVDPKMVELNMYNGIPHLLSPVVTEVDKVVPLLKNAIKEMERRYRLFSQLGVRNLDSYRKMRLEKIAKGDTSLNNLPTIVIVIDELADLMMAAPEEVEGMICRLAQLARATGIHLVIATQRPSVDVITGLIKANIPTRISFMVSSSVDSRTIIDMGGAERLLGRGDMLYLPADAGRPERIQCSFLADEEAERLVQYWQQQIIDHARVLSGEDEDDPLVALAPPEVEPGWEIKEEPADDFELDDDLLEKAEEIVREYGRASISLLQRRLRVGYSRAARLIDLLEEHGIIGHSESGGRAREVLESTSGGSYDRHSSSDARTMVDEVDDIMAEEKARDEFLRKQASRRSPQGKNVQGDEI